ncbi:hypothetical protein V1477_008085 [Vespula maculifrons]|uniref:Uncharacterized protein n=1 Tax=Vespula maculifrons TaxID=7453 RepID=A0ABD2CEZ7_VESMC
MNNTVFSKMMENIYNHILGITITKWKRQYSAILLHAKPNFQRTIVYDINWFDTSDYSIDNVYDMLLTNKKMLGLIKIKTIEELCAKSYVSDKKYTL